MKFININIMFGFCFLLFLNFNGCSSPTEINDPGITFSDPAFEALIREVLNKPSGDIIKNDMMTIHYISGYERNISSIDGIEYCKNLEWINIRTNQISDISSFAVLKRLQYINLWTNQISDISVLSELTSLTNLYIGRNQIEDIYPLIQNQGIGNGDIVVISYNPLSAISLNTYIPELQARGVEIYYTTQQ